MKLGIAIISAKFLTEALCLF